MREPGWIGVSLMLAMGCIDPPVRSEARPLPRTDKAALYGDPGLVPTREGEHVRRELARAGEIEAAIALLEGVHEVRVDVELDGHGATEGVLVVVRHEAEIDPTETVHAVTSTILGEAARPAVRLLAIADPASPEAPPPEQVGPWFLLLLSLASIGLGASLGITVERLRQRERA